VSHKGDTLSNDKLMCVASLLFAAAALPAHAAHNNDTTPNPAAIQSTVDSFRAALGALNANQSGSFVTGRREINWDGVPNALAAPNNLPANFFNVNSPRGVLFSTPGTGFQVSASTMSGFAVRFGTIDVSYPTQFQAFSPERLFTALGSTTLDVSFFVPGTNIPATVAGFGAVFTDVESVSVTKFTVFLGDGTNGGQFAVPTTASGGLSFLGLTDPRRYSRIRITSGSGVLAAGALDNPAGGADMVVMDDFIYGEPVPTLDVDASNTQTRYDPLTDGLLIVRYLLGVTGTPLTIGALGATASQTDPATIKTNLDAIRNALDIDGNNVVEAATDGLLILRYMFGLRGDPLVASAFDPMGSRNTAMLIEPYLSGLMP
jgi:hypothetical protein